MNRWKKTYPLDAEEEKNEGREKKTLSEMCICESKTALPSA